MIQSSEIDNAPFKRAWQQMEKALLPLNRNLLRKRTDVIPALSSSTEDQIAEIIAFDLAIDPLGTTKRPILYQEEDEFGVSWKDSYLPQNFVFPDGHQEFARLDGLLMNLQIAVEDWHRTIIGVAQNTGIEVNNLSLFDPRSSISDYVLRDDQEHNSPARIQTWSTTCLAPLDLMRYTSHHLQHGDSDELALLLSIASGWVSANVGSRYQKKINVETFLNDADIISNIVMALADSQAIPAIFTDQQLQTEEVKLNSEIDVNRFSLQVSRPVFSQWLKVFKDETFLELSRFVDREIKHKSIEVDTFFVPGDDSDNLDALDNLFRAHTVNIANDPVFDGFIRRELLTRVIDELSPQQLRVLYLNSRSYTDQQIADELEVKVSTVRTHIKRTKAKAKKITSDYE